MLRKSLIVLFLLIGFTFSPAAQTLYYQGGIYSVLDKSAMTCKLVKGSGLIRSGHAEIPDEVQGYSVIEIGSSAFFQCTNLKTVKFPANLQAIEDSAFSGCTSLQDVNIESVYLNTIEIAAFAGCTSLMDIVISPDNPNFVSSDGMVFTKRKDKVVCAAAGRTEFKVPSPVSTIGNCAFIGCKNAVKITLPSVRFIDNSAFNGCSALESINIPSSVVEIGASAFSRCESLTSIDIPAKVYKIGAGAFGGCKSLIEINIAEDNGVFKNENSLVLSKSGKTIVVCPAGLKDVEIPETVIAIAGSAFTGCANLESLHIPPTVTEIDNYAFKDCVGLKKLELSEGLKEIYYSTFAGCTSLTDIIIPSTVSQIGSSAFSGCSSLKFLYIPKGVATIKAFAFKNCKELKYIVFGESVKVIEMKSFEGSDNIEKIVSYSEEAPQLTANAFDETVYTNADLKVNANCLEKYETANNWSNFKISEIKDSDKLATSIILDRTEHECFVGDNFLLTAGVYPDEAFDKSLTWTSSDENVANVDAEGNVTAIGTGNAKITASCGDISASCRLTVKPILAETLSISPEAWESEEGTSFMIEAVISPENTTDKTLNYESDDESVATVDASGRVTVINDGSCIITVSTMDGSGLKAKCFVTKLTGIETGTFCAPASFDVYNQAGMLVKRHCSTEEMEQLPPAIYIIKYENAAHAVVVR